MVTATNGHAPMVKAAQTEQDKQIEQASAYSMVVNLPPFWGNRWFGGSGYGWALPGIEQVERQAYLGTLRYHPQNALFQAAFLSLQRQVTGIGYELKGKRRVDWYQSVVNNADRGRGWTSLMSKVLWDYTTLDDGAVIEVIGKGAPDSPLARELVVGLGYLDPLRCYFTENLEYPVWYQDYNGKLHKIHYTRVWRWVDQPLGAQQFYGRGFAALSRAVAWVQQAISTMTYTGERLNDEPPAGILNIANLLNEKAFKNAYEDYKASLTTRGDSHYRPPMVYQQQGEGATFDFIPFTDAPAGYDFEKYVRLQAQGVAAALGIDPQDILPLVSGSFGTGKEAEVLARKAHGKTLGYVLREWERFLNNRVFPDNLEFSFKYQDSEQSIAEAEKAKMHMDVAAQLSGIAGARVAVQYLANTVEAFRDVLLDENGQVRVYDDDIDDGTKPELPEGEQAPQQGQAPQSGQPNTETVDDTQAEVEEDAPVTDEAEKAYTVKAYEDVRLRFVSALEDTLTGANDADFNRRRAGTIIRALIAKDGREAYKEGLLQGGVEVDTLTGDDLDAYNRLVTEASGYVSNLTEQIYSKGLTPAQVKQRADMWSNVTLQKFYYWGIESGDKNGLYMWKLGPTEEHCKDCARLNGQIHRFKDWRESQYMPGSQSLACNGYNCQCKLVKTKGRVRGKL